MPHSPAAIAGARTRAFDNVLGLSTVFFDASQRLTAAFAAAGREAILHNSRHFAAFGHGQIDSTAQFPATLWLETSARTTRLLDAAWGILGDTQRSLLQAAETQVQAFDDLVLAMATKAPAGTPWESRFALAALRTTLESAERTLHGVDAAAEESLSLAADETRRMASVLAGEPKTTRPETRGRKTS
ncbi:MAG: hypothetical protein FIB06_10685 [Betaproteobacteria bacterium]|nr:hypothetical protein [Betaproteobacteria bacterium]